MFCTVDAGRKGLCVITKWRRRTPRKRGHRWWFPLLQVDYQSIIMLFMKIKFVRSRDAPEILLLKKAGNPVWFKEIDCAVVTVVYYDKQNIRILG